MNSGQRNEIVEAAGQSDSLPCSTRSAEVLLVVLILVSLNIVAAYDWALSRVLRLFGRRHTAPPASFETTHVCKSFGRRVKQKAELK